MHLLFCGSVDAVVAISAKAVVLSVVKGVSYVSLVLPLQLQCLPDRQVWTVARMLSPLTHHFLLHWKTGMESKKIDDAINMQI